MNTIDDMVAQGEAWIQLRIRELTKESLSTSRFCELNDRQRKAMSAIFRERREFRRDLYGHLNALNPSTAAILLAENQGREDELNITIRKLEDAVTYKKGIDEELKLCMSALAECGKRPQASTLVPSNVELPEREEDA